MDKTFSVRLRDSLSDNPKPVLSEVEGSKTCGEQGRTIQNLKFFVLATLFLTTVSLAEAQQTGTIPRIGILSFGFARLRPTLVEAFHQGMRALGYVEGRDVIFEQRYAEANLNRVADMAAELVRLKVQIILTTSSQATRAAQLATRNIPIVMAVSGDPVAAGFVASLAHPGGNITGLSNLSQDLSGKRAELLKETIPKLSRVSVLYDPTVPGPATQLRVTEATARGLGFQLQTVEVRAPGDFDKAFQAAKAAKAQALIVFPSSLLNNHATTIANLAVKSKLPAIYAIGESVEAGGLMSYGPSYPDMGRRAAVYVDKILKGRTPADLPVEQPMKFEFIINLKAAKAIGLTIPPNVLVRADKVIR